MISGLRAFWQGLGRRERVLTGSGIGVLLCALLFVSAVEPAWKTRARLRSELPALREQSLELAALAQEAASLRQRASAAHHPGELKGVIAQSLASAALQKATVAAIGPSQWIVSAKAVPAAAWVGWLEQTVRELRLHVASARIARSDGAGLIDAEVTLNVPAKR